VGSRVVASPFTGVHPDRAQPPDQTFIFAFSTIHRRPFIAMAVTCACELCKVAREGVTHHPPTAKNVQGLTWGLNRGFPVTKRDLKARPVSLKGKTSKRSQFVKSVVRDVAGFAPYERRIMVRFGKLDTFAFSSAKVGWNVGAVEELQGQEGTEAYQEEGEFHIVRGCARSSMVTFFVTQLGTLRRAKRKVDELQTVIAEQRRAGH
jgi:hypothetical protein